MPPRISTSAVSGLCHAHLLSSDVRSQEHLPELTKATVALSAELETLQEVQLSLLRHADTHVLADHAGMRRRSQNSRVRERAFNN